MSKLRPELGIRLALGAERSDLVRLILHQGLHLIGIGACLGLLGALGLTRFLTRVLYHTSPTDPATFAVVVAAVLVIGVLACYLPARRAARVDPVSILRDE